MGKPRDSRCHAMMHVAYLRQPRSLDDRRDDPFWEFGAFGLTGCHSNLLRALCSGARVLFVQGGRQEIRAVGLTPPIEVIRRARCVHIRWDMDYRPIPFGSAPLLIDNALQTDFPAIRRLIEGVARTTACGRAGSRLRARVEPLDCELQEQIAAYFDKRGPHPRISQYMDAVKSRDTGWHENAMKRCWGSLESRRTLIANLRRNQGCAPEAAKLA